MIWLRLKLDLLPCIAQEIDRFSAQYMDQAEKAANGDQDAYQNLIQMQEDIKKRMNEIDVFYEKNYADYRVGYFEKLKIKLRKLLSPFIPANKMIYQEMIQAKKDQQLQEREQMIKKQFEQQQNENNYAELSSSDNNDSKVKIIKQKDQNDEIVLAVQMTKQQFLQYLQKKQLKIK